MKREKKNDTEIYVHISHSVPLLSNSLLFIYTEIRKQKKTKIFDDK